MYNDCLLLVSVSPADVRASNGAAVVATDNAAPATAAVYEEPTDADGAAATRKTEATNDDTLIASVAATDVHSADAAEADATGRRSQRRTRRHPPPPPSTPSQPTPMGRWPPNNGGCQRKRVRHL